MSKLLRLVQVGKRELMMDDDTYRDMLENVTGQRTAKNLNTDQLKDVIDRMKSLGFIPRAKQPTKKPKHHRTSESSKIEVIWTVMHQQGFIKDGSSHALDAYIRRMTNRVNGTGINVIQWLDAMQARYVLEALKGWHYRVMRNTLKQSSLNLPSHILDGTIGYDKMSTYYKSQIHKLRNKCE